MKWGHLITIGCVFLLMALGACVPNAAIYYRPSMEGGYITAGNCVPTENRIEFSLKSLLISTIVNISKNELTISVFLNPLPDQTVHFASDIFQVNDIGKGMHITDASIVTSREDGVKSPSIPFPADGKKASPLGFNFSIHISFLDTNIESFELVSPPIIIDGVETEFPVIRFQRKTWVGISPLNC